MMKTEMPAVIDVCGMPYTIVVDTDEIQAVYPGEPVEGVHLSTESRIVLHADLPPTHARATALHEILHAADYVAGVNLKEQDVASLGTVLFAIIRHNPDLVKWLMEW